MKSNPDSIAELLKALADYNERHDCQNIAVYRLSIYDDESGYISNRAEDRTDFHDIAECLEILKR